MSPPRIKRRRSEIALDPFMDVHLGGLVDHDRPGVLLNGQKLSSMSVQPDKPTSSSELASLWHRRALFGFISGLPCWIRNYKCAPMQQTGKSMKKLNKLIVMTNLITSAAFSA